MDLATIITVGCTVISVGLSLGALFSSRASNKMAKEANRNAQDSNFLGAAEHGLQLQSSFEGAAVQIQLCAAEIRTAMLPYWGDKPDDVNCLIALHRPIEQMSAYTRQMDGQCGRLQTMVNEARKEIGSDSAIEALRTVQKDLPLLRWSGRTLYGALVPDAKNPGHEYHGKLAAYYAFLQTQRCFFEDDEHYLAVCRLTKAFARRGGTDADELEPSEKALQKSLGTLDEDRGYVLDLWLEFIAETRGDEDYANICCWLTEFMDRTLHTHTCDAVDKYEPIIRRAFSGTVLTPVPNVRPSLWSKSRSPQAIKS